jgi:hypothetical protein
MTKPIIVRDTREKQGWVFEESNDVGGTAVSKLDTGDYSIKGLESVFLIERKQSVQEIANNIQEDRFDRELERLALIPHPFIICEFNVSDIMTYPFSAKLSPHVKAKIKVRGPFILKKLNEYMVNFPALSILYCGKHGKETALSLIKRIWTKHKIN